MYSVFGEIPYSSADAAETILKTEPTLYSERHLFIRGESSEFRADATSFGENVGKLTSALILHEGTSVTSTAALFKYFSAASSAISCIFLSIVRTTPLFFKYDVSFIFLFSPTKTLLTASTLY